MRGKISDQDLTNYALNELPPRERLYVESLLAVSEECRHDVYEMIDVAMLLEEGFEQDGERELEMVLRPEQRAALLAEPTSVLRNYFSKVAVVFAAAAAVALAVVQPNFWKMPGSATQVARVSSQVSNYVVEAVTPDEGVDFSGLLANAGQLADDPVLTKWFSSDWFSGDRAAQSMAYAPSAAAAWETISYGSFEGNP